MALRDGRWLWIQLRWLEWDSAAGPTCGRLQCAQAVHTCGALRGGALGSSRWESQSMCRSALRLQGDLSEVHEGLRPGCSPLSSLVRATDLLRTQDGLCLPPSNGLPRAQVLWEYTEGYKVVPMA